MLKPLLTGKSMGRLAEVADYYGSVETLTKLYTDPTYLDYLQGIYSTIKKLHEDNRL